MTTKQRSSFGGVLLCALVCFSATCFGQDSQQTTDRVRRIEELERKAYGLVEEIAAGAHGLKLPENRAFVSASAAVLLWPHDEPRARALFWDALGSINLMMTPAGNGVSSKLTAKQNDQKHYFAVFSARQTLLRKVSQHDPQLALDMLRSSRHLRADQVNARFSFRLPDDSELEQQIATEAATRDPEQALRLARASLAKGFTFQLLELLDRLNARDQDVATKFASDIIDKLHARNLSTDIYGSRIAVDLVTWSRPPTADGSGKDASRAWAYLLKLDNQKRKQLVEIIANAALEASANSTLLYAISDILPEIQQFVPERMALLQRKLRAFEQTLSKEQRGWKTYNALARSGSPEDMIAGSMRVDDERRDMLRQQAIMLAVYRQRADALRDFIKAEFEDESVRRSLEDDLDSEQVNDATARGDVQELRKLLRQVRRSEERARAMAELAMVLEKKGDHEEAVKLLDQAHSLIKVDFESETQTNALVALVAAYAAVEPSKAFVIMERAIDRANDQVSKVLLLDKIIRTGVVRNGEIMLENSGVVSCDLMMFRYGKAVVAMANADFNRTKAAADRLERTELRLLGQLSLAQALLAKDERRKR